MSAAQKAEHRHSHMWLVGVLGMIAGAGLMIYVPSLKPVSNVIFLFALFHVVGALVLLASFYMTGGKRLVALLLPRFQCKQAEQFDFGWAPAWTYGPWIGSLVFLSLSIAIQAVAPSYWPLAVVLTLLAAGFFAGGIITRSVGRYEDAVLPLVDLLPGESETKVVLDAGCGAGRTSVALGRALKRARIIALDRFDSDYIDGGGRRLLEQNLKRAGLLDRTQIHTGDLTAMPFPENSFDAVVSAHAIDHLGSSTENGLREVLRTLKPGGHFLLLVWIPGWTMFAIANVLAFSLQSKEKWRQMLTRAGFTLSDEGSLNGNWFALVRKPEI